jgi:hypothetical protein
MVIWVTSSTPCVTLKNDQFLSQASFGHFGGTCGLLDTRVLKLPMLWASGMCQVLESLMGPCSVGLVSFQGIQS